VIHAFAHLDPAAARAATPRAGRLHGIPVGVKDVLDTGDMPSGYGSPIWTGWRPRADSAPVAWTRAVGGVVIGKTVTTELPAVGISANQQEAVPLDATWGPDYRKPDR
jgi:Asp-tRNA(Asn)/Glu-tRNA(Gln) amidotransferase A subunit family amidase